MAVEGNIGAFSRTLTPGVHAPSEARRFVRAATGSANAEWAKRLDLVVSEAVTNAVVHGSGDVELTIRGTDAGIRVEVSDRSTRLPTMKGHGSGNGGFGLRIIDQVTQRWGVRQWPNGKTVWFDM